MFTQPIVEVDVRQTAQMFLVRALLRVSDVDLPLPRSGRFGIIAEQRRTALRTSEIANKQAKPTRRSKWTVHVLAASGSDSHQVYSASYITIPCFSNSQSSA